MTETGKQVVFKQLLDGHRSIQIPMIQRDFAQGRESAEEIRRDFLTALDAALQLPADDPSLPLNLDFVYGSVEGSDGESRFSPLDGQQRLTTLFLLHWYFAWKDDRWGEFKTLFELDGHSRFTYRVRPSSSDFFDFLVAFRPEYSPKDVLSLSELIVDQPQYFRNWRFDPTIRATLVMLDSIHEYFSGSKGFFGRITNLEQPAITFQLLDLKKFDLSDDLYIKMNARGMPLTPFETFKARYVQGLEKQFHGQVRRIGDQEFPIHDFVSRRMDTAWMDLFWTENKSETKRSASVDDNIFNLFRVAALLTRDPDNQNCLRDVNLLTKTRPDYSTFHNHNWLDEEFTATLVPLLEQWCRTGTGFAPLLPNNDYFDEKKLLFKMTSDSLGLDIPELLLLFGYVLFIKLHEKSLDANEFQQWMRIVHNLVINSNIDRAERLPGGMAAVLMLLPYSNRILEHLASLDSTEGLSSFPKRQIDEETLKSALLLNHDGWRALIDRAERHGYFRGQIEFLLEFCGAINESQENAAKDWDDATHEECQRRFEGYLVKAEATFTDSGLDNTSFLWQRALLSIGDYLFPMTSQRKSLLFDAPTDVNSWKRLLRGYQSHEANGRRLLKSLWDRLDARAAFADQLETLISGSALEPWREAFVKSPTAIRYCVRRTIRWSSDREIYLLSKTQMNSAHAELFSYTFFRDELVPKQAKGEFSPLHLSPEYYFTNETGIEPGFRFNWVNGGKWFTFEFEWNGEGYDLYILSEDIGQRPFAKQALIDKAGFNESHLLKRLSRQTSVAGFYDCLKAIRDAIKSEQSA